MKQHRITCRPIFAHYIISGRNRAFDFFVGFGQWVSGLGRENPPASNSGLSKRNFLKKHACLRTIELLCSLNIEGATYSLVPPPSKIIGGSNPPVPPGIYAYACYILQFQSNYGIPNPCNPTYPSDVLLGQLSVSCSFLSKF